MLPVYLHFSLYQQNKFLVSAKTQMTASISEIIRSLKEDRTNFYVIRRSTEQQFLHRVLHISNPRCMAFYTTNVDNLSCFHSDASVCYSA